MSTRSSHSAADSDSDCDAGSAGRALGSPFLPWLDQIRPYVPGKPPESVLGRVRPSDLCRLASNENPLGPSPRALAAIREGLGELHRYPDDQSQRLKEALSAHHSIPVDQIAVGNGSNDLIDLLVHITLSRGRQLVMAEASFPTCRIAALGVGAGLRLVPQREDRHDLEAMARAVDAHTSLVYICNPNNPTGTACTAEEVDRFLERLPAHTLAVFDEAYFEYVDDPRFPDLLPRVRAQENVAVLRTFSKCHALAALRVGYAFCPRSVVERLEKVRLPFNVNGVGHRAAIAALADHEQLRKSLDFNASGKAQLRSELSRLGVNYRDSQTNFLMVQVPGPPGDLFGELLGHGVIIRPLQSFGLSAEHYRVTVGTPEENARFVQALESVLRGAASADPGPRPASRGRP